jgi:uncharacterized protein YceH (UPF0502 family)
MDTESNTIPSDQAEPASEAMLNALEARVLGALMEKQLTTPDTYPLSLNSLVLACNQKTSREPIMNLTNGETQHTINELEKRGLVSIEYGSRADKYNQKLARVIHLEKSEQAIFSLLLLRGPQTLNELLSRSKRMHDFTSTQDILDIMERHLAKLKPLIIKIPAQAGQREDRYSHLLCGEPDLSAIANTTPRGQSHASIAELQERVDSLEKQVAWLTEQIKNQ